MLSTSPPNEGPVPVAPGAPSTGSSLGDALGRLDDVGSRFILIGFISIFLTRPTLIFQGVSVSLILSQRDVQKNDRHEKNMIDFFVIIKSSLTYIDFHFCFFPYL